MRRKTLFARNLSPGVFVQIKAILPTEALIPVKAIRRSAFRIAVLFLTVLSNFSFGQNTLTKQWDKRYGGTVQEGLTCFQQTTDGGYILGGVSVSGISGDKTQSNWGGEDYWIVKTDSLGNIEWDKRFGGTDPDVLFSLQQTADGGYILGGFSWSGISGDKTQPSWGDHDYWIVKIDPLGNMQWNKRFGGTNSDYLFSLQQTTDGGYILGGWSYSGTGGNKTQPLWGEVDYWIVKTDSLGNMQWDKRFGGTGWDQLYSLQQTTDGGYILGGHSNSGISGDKTQPSFGGFDYWIVKTDSLGNMQWDKRFGGTSHDKLNSLQQTTDGGYILGGRSLSGIGGDKTQASWGGYDYWIVKTDPLGNMLWDKRFGGINDEEYYDNPGNVTQTSDKGYLIAGASDSPISGDKTENNLGLKQTWVVKTDSSGILQWDKTIFTTGTDLTGLVIQSKDGCYVMANCTDGGIGGYKTQLNWDTNNYDTPDYWIVKFCDTTGKPAFFAIDTSICKKFCTDFFDQSTNYPTAWQWIFDGGSPALSSLQNPTGICYNEPGEYKVILITTNASGNDTLTLNNYITVYGTPQFPIITQAGYTLTSSASSSYQWQFNSVNISGATNQSYTILQSGLYTVIIGDLHGCVNSASKYVLITGIAGQSTDESFLIEPNPSDGNFTCLISNVAPGNCGIEIFNFLGQQVFSEIGISNSSFQKEIHLVFPPEGIYLVTISTEEKTYQKKIVVDR